MSTPTPTSGAVQGHEVPLPHELTAEWTVRAHLTFARAGETVQKEFSAPETVHPMRVVYKWCTPCEEPETEQDVDKASRDGKIFQPLFISLKSSTDSGYCGNQLPFHKLLGHHQCGLGIWQPTCFEGS